MKPPSLDDLIAGLRALGLKPGDRVAVHTSYRAVRPVEGGPENLIQALMRAVGGTSGTLAMPTFNIVRPIYRPADTPSACGVLTEIFRKMPGVFRSLHPTHSVAVWGKDADWIASAHAQGRTALGVDSPFDRLAQKGGKVLLLGVGMDRNSMVHVGESHFRAPYLNVLFSPEYGRPIRIETADGSIRTFVMKECPGCSRNFGVVGERMEHKGWLRKATLGQADAVVMRAADVIAAACELLAEDVTRLLCDNPECPCCPNARKAAASS